MSIDKTPGSISNQPIHKRLDASGLVCPMPLLKLKQSLRSLESGKVLEVVTTDAGSLRDFPVYLKQIKAELLSVVEREADYRFLIKKSEDL